MAEEFLFKQVVSIIDERTSVVCLHAAGDIVPVTDPFETLAGDFMEPPFHIYCRSLVQPWVPGMARTQREAANAELQNRPESERRLGPNGEIGGEIPAASPVNPPSGHSLSLADDPDIFRPMALVDNAKDRFEQLVESMRPSGNPVTAYLGTVMSADDAAAVRQAFEDALAVKYPKGVTATVDTSSLANGKTRFVVTFEDAKGNPVGRASRKIEQVEVDGELVWSVEHDVFTFNEDVQGHGIGTEFLKRSEAFYRAHGIRQITMNANLDVGGYAWARSGFDWRDVDTMLDVQKRISPTMWRMMGKPEREVNILQDLYDRMTPENFAAGTAPTPYEVAMAGYTEGATMWAGKEIMLGANWFGVKRL